MRRDRDLGGGDGDGRGVMERKKGGRQQRGSEGQKLGAAPRTLGSENRCFEERA